MRIERLSELQGGLAAELNDHALDLAVGGFLLDDRKHILRRKRLEIEPVRGIVVGGDRFRIAIDHNGLIAGFRQRKSGVAAAIIEFNSLPNPVRAAAKYDDLFA